MKRLLKITFILALVLCFAMPAFAIKILPYSMPLQDIMKWDKYEATLKLSNPEGEAISVAWPTTVDLWNYDGTTWTFDLPSGNTFNFAKQLKGTITDPSDEVSGVFGQVNSGDAVGWTVGEVTGVRGELNIATLTGGTFGTGAGGWFELEYDVLQTGDGVGLTCALYAKVTNEVATRAPCSVLYLEDVITGAGDARSMPMIVMTSVADDEADKSEYAFSLGFAAAGTTVSTGADDGDVMFRTGAGVTNGDAKLLQGIQIIVNSAVYYIPVIADTDWVDE